MVMQGSQRGCTQLICAKSCSPGFRVRLGMSGSRQLSLASCPKSSFPNEVGVPLSLPEAESL